MKEMSIFETTFEPFGKQEIWTGSFPFWLFQENRGGGGGGGGGRIKEYAHFKLPTTVKMHDRDNKMTSKSIIGF